MFAQSGIKRARSGRLSFVTHKKGGESSHLAKLEGIEKCLADTEGDEEAPAAAAAPDADAAAAAAAPCGPPPPWTGAAASGAGLMLAMTLGLRARSLEPWPSLPWSPSPQLKTSPEEARARVWPSPPREEDTWCRGKNIV